MSVAIFHDPVVTNEASDNKRLTSKKNKRKETLHIKDKKKDMLGSIEIKGEVREPERHTLYDKKYRRREPERL